MLLHPVRHSLRFAPVTEAKAAMSGECTCRRTPSVMAQR